MNLLFYIFSTMVGFAVILPDCTILASPRRPKAKMKKYEIDFNNTYYTSRFELCKKLRNFNPVETFRAQAYAAAVFRKCGPKMIIRLGTKYNFPAYGNSRLFLVSTVRRIFRR